MCHSRGVNGCFFRVNGSGRWYEEAEARVVIRRSSMSRDHKSGEIKV